MNESSGEETIKFEKRKTTDTTKVPKNSEKVFVNESRLVRFRRRRLPSAKQIPPSIARQSASLIPQGKATAQFSPLIVS